jgi:hypothetical protein
MHEDEGKKELSVVSKAQDFHSMLEKVLESYILLQNSGFYWDLHYKNQVYKDIEFVLFTPFIRADGEEADRLCGKYLNRTGNVSQLCRYCECPLKKSDSPFAKFPLKLAPNIERLIQQNDRESLRSLSQHKIQNAMYKVCFGCHTRQGIHGACPLDMLHAIQLGIFKYVRECFFEQIGESSKLSDEINSLSMSYASLFSRQSDRDLPVTRFASGIKKGKLMANEYPGILLCLAAILRSTCGKQLLSGKKNILVPRRACVIGAIW